MRARSDSRCTYLKKAGPIREFKLNETREFGDSMGFRYEVGFDSMTALLEVARDKDGKIVHFSLQPE